MFSCRRVAAADEDELVRMITALYEEDPSTFPMSPQKARRTLATFAAQPARGVAVVLELAGSLAGYALLTSYWSNELGGEIAVVDELYVLPALRGRGLARWFLDSLLTGQLPWLSDAVAFELEVTPRNARARTLYERLGFAPKRNATLRALRRA